jgi:hypothetical protein
MYYSEKFKSDYVAVIIVLVITKKQFGCAYMKVREMH